MDTRAYPSARRAPWTVGYATALGALVGALHGLATAAVVTWRFRDHILAPPLAGRVQLFDPASKLLALLHDMPGEFLQHFYGPGFAAKLPLFLEMVIANVVVGAVLGLALGMALWLCPRAWSVRPRIALYGLGYLALTAALHAVALVPLVVSPHHSRTLAYHLGQMARRMRDDGPAIDLAVTAFALVAALWLAPRLQRTGGLRAFATAGATTAVALVIVSSVPALNVRGADAARPLAPTTRPRNVVLISIDSLRADHLGCYGYRRPTSPRLDQLAGAGLRFDAAYSTSSWTLPSHASMLTGRYPLSHGAVILDRRLSRATPTLPTVLGPAGYTTAGFVSFEFLRRRYGFDAGFDHFDDFTTAVEGNNQEHHLTTGPLLNAEIIPWIERNAERPFFLFAHYFDVHYDYDPPPPYDTMFDDDYVGPDLRRYSHNPAIHRNMPKRHLEHLIALYDGEIRLTDKMVGDVIDTIDRVGVGDDTLVIVTADHGEEFFEHGDRGHGTTLHEEVVRVPLLMRWPRGVAAGGAIETPVSVADLAPTIYDLTGVAAPDGMDGESLAAVMLGQPGTPHPVYAHLYARKRPIISAMVRAGAGKYVQDLHTPRAGLFDLGADPGEQHNGAGSADARPLTTPLLGWLDQQWSAYRALPAESDRRVTVDQDNIDQLRALGYVE